MFHNNIPSSFFLITLIVIILPLLSSSSTTNTTTTTDVDQPYIDCKPLIAACGFELKIVYPFWDSRQQEYCGHPAFKVECVDNSLLTINIKGQSYNILSINYEAKVFTISKPQFSYDGPCTAKQSQLTNTSLDLKVLNFTPNSQNATLFYDCVSPSLGEDNPPYAFVCSISTYAASKQSFESDLGFLALDKTWEKMLRESCSFEIFVPILKTAAAELNHGTSDIQKVFNKGFEVKWMVAEGDGRCEECRNSGGRCGFNQTSNEVTCFCKDGVYDSSCGSHNTEKISNGRTRNWNIIVALAGIGTGTIIGIMYLLWRCIISPRYDKASAINKLFTKKTSSHSISEATGSDEAELQDLPLLKFEMLAIATNNFRENNKLGQGGFGPVYKGQLENGKEIAVKRLSRASGQGQQEFMNEVIVISMLQHKNLVKLLGCCVEGEEKLLVYEFLPNKSLDALLFDPLKRKLLGWKKRFDIIKGICRGVLYLHRDSRLKIIHRDLKASNILLDVELNPKISDFGMAKIFEGKQDQANTLRVVGTYGYMSPEYAMEGRFSEKSDVFSLGVLLLEIVCGRRNSVIQDDSISLIGYAWEFWNEDNILSLIDPTISDPCCEFEVLKCIHVGLLCVQEFPQDRPNISTVISMLDCEVIDLPQPLQPGFTQNRYYPSVASDVQQHCQQNCSVNIVSISSVHGR